jgi:hypothetical protein
LLASALYDDDAAKDAGAAYVFGRNHGGPGVWGQITKLVASDGSIGDKFGWSLFVSAEGIGIGASSHQHTTGSHGAVYLFERDLGGPGAWGELTELAASDGGGGFGYALSSSGETVLVGASPGAYVFERGSQSVRYCTAGVSASGCQAVLTACGTPSASASSGFVLASEGLEGTANGLFFFGSNGRQASPWGNGTSFQCAAPPLHRGGALIGGGTQGACDGALSQDLNARWCPTCPKPHHNPGAGAVVQAQLWYRDPLSTSNQTTSLSDAVEFVMLP